MRSLSANDPCPCGSGNKYKRCCGLFHRGKAPDAPEQLMRSRYTAYALGLVDYILETTHPDGAAWEADTTAWRASVLAFSRETLFLQLEIVETSETAEEGFVSFRAHFQQAGKPVVMEEHSLFRRHNGRWCYVSAQ